MKVEQRRGEAEGDAVPDLPCERVIILLHAEKVPVEASIGEELVDEDELGALVAPTHELHQIPMPKPANDFDLRQVLFDSLFGVARDFLHCHLLLTAT